MADDWFVPDAPAGATGAKPAAPNAGDDWVVPPEKQDVSAGMVLSGVPVLGAYIPQAEAAIRAAAHPLTGVGKPGATYAERYAANLPERQAQYQMAEEEHPYASAGAKALGGGLALAPLGATALGARALGAAGPLLARVPLGMASGGTIAAADAAARGQDPLIAGVVGGVAGGALPVAGWGLGKAVQGVRNWWAPGSVAEGLAARMGKTALDADSLNPAAISARAAELGPAATGADYGPNVRGLTQAIATQPGTGKAAVFEAMQQRAEGARGRIENAVTQALGPRQDMALLTRGETQARGAAADPLYEAWRSTTVHPTAEVKNLVTTFEQHGLLNDARRLMSLDGKNAEINFFTSGDRKNWPTTEAFDYVKQAIDDRIGAAVRTGARNDVRILTGAKRRLDQAIENSNPAAADVWRQARAAWANPTAIMEARSAGQDLFTKGVRRDQLRFDLAAMAQPERLAFREGARDAIAEMMDASVRGDTNARNVLLAPANQEKVALLGQNRAAAELGRTLEQELTFAQNHQRLIGNSETAARQAMGEVTKAPGGSPITDYLRHIDVSKPATWIGRGHSILNEAQTMATARQAAQYEQARALLARRLMQQGPQAEQSLIQMLAPPAPGTTLGPRFDRAFTAVGQGAAQGGIPRMRGYADGGKYPGDEPIVVGERGPEVIVPDRPGTVIPANGPMPSREEIQRYLRATTQDLPKFGPGGIPINPAGVDAMLARAPESQNIEDWRGIGTGEHDPRGGFAAAAARTARSVRPPGGRTEGAGTRFVEGGYGIPAAIGGLNEGARRAMESAGSLQRGGSYDPAPVMQQAIGAAGAPLAGPVSEGVAVSAEALRRFFQAQAQKAALRRQYTEAK